MVSAPGDAARIGEHFRLCGALQPEIAAVSYNTLKTRLQRLERTMQPRRGGQWPVDLVLASRYSHCSQRPARRLPRRTHLTREPPTPTASMPSSRRITAMRPLKQLQISVCGAAVRSPCLRGLRRGERTAAQGRAGRRGTHRLAARREYRLGSLHYPLRPDRGSVSVRALAA